jgi:hypothetical protein
MEQEGVVILRRVFHQINGRELSDVILADLRERLSRDTNFSQNITYRNMEYHLRLWLEVASEDPHAVEVRLSGAVQALDPKDPDAPIKGVSEPKLIKVEFSRRIDLRETPPDLVREKAGLRSPQPKKIEIGPMSQIVDTSYEELNRDRTDEVKTVEVKRNLDAPPKVSGKLGPAVADSK